MLTEGKVRKATRTLAKRGVEHSFMKSGLLVEVGVMRLAMEERADHVSWALG